MTANKESIYWKSNPKWFFINAEGKYELTDMAPERAVKSFMLFNTPRSKMKSSHIEIEMEE